MIDPDQRSELRRWNPIEQREDIVKDNRQWASVSQPFIAAQSPLRMEDDAPLTQLLNTYIVAPTHRGLILIHQQCAHERVLYERYAAVGSGQKIASQRSLFPTALELSTSDAVLLQDLLPDINNLGYLIEPFGKDSFVIQGTPADIVAGNEKAAIENLLEQFKHFSSDRSSTKREKLIRAMAWQHAIKAGKSLTDREMEALVKDLFACTQPNITAGGNPTYMELKKEYLEKLFGRE